MKQNLIENQESATVQSAKQNAPTETRATKTPSGPGQPALTGGVSSPVPCSASQAPDKQNSFSARIRGFVYNLIEFGVSLLRWFSNGSRERKSGPVGALLPRMDNSRDWWRH